MPTILERLAIFLYGKTKKGEDRLLKSFDIGKAKSSDFRRFSWLPRPF
jgi:hypothetical protein